MMRALSVLVHVPQPSRYVALYNAGDTEHVFTVKAADLELGGTVAAFDLVDRADIGKFVSIPVEVDLAEGLHTVRSYNPTGWTPDIDLMRVK